MFSVMNGESVTTTGSGLSINHQKLRTSHREIAMTYPEKGTMRTGKPGNRRKTSQRNKKRMEIIGESR